MREEVTGPTPPEMDQMLVKDYEIEYMDEPESR